MPKMLDRVDRRILDTLQADARISNQEAREADRPVPCPVLATAAAPRGGRVHLGLRHVAERIGHRSADLGLRARLPGKPSS